MDGSLASPPFPGLARHCHAAVLEVSLARVAKASGGIAHNATHRFASQYVVMILT
jgi:hypothetical protein